MAERSSEKFAATIIVNELELHIHKPRQKKVVMKSENVKRKQKMNCNIFKVNVKKEETEWDTEKEQKDQ